MYEYGLVDRLMQLVLVEVVQCGAVLRVVHVRFGALANLDKTHLRADFAHMLEHLNKNDIALHIECAPEQPSELKIVNINIVT